MFSPAEYLQHQAWSDATLEFDRRGGGGARGASGSACRSRRRRARRARRARRRPRRVGARHAVRAEVVARQLLPLASPATGLRGVATSRNQWVSGTGQVDASGSARSSAPTCHREGIDALADEYKASHDQWRTVLEGGQGDPLLRFELTDADQLKDRHGFGAKMLEKVREMLKTGHIKRLDSLQASERVQVVRALCKVHGVGQKTAEEWYSSKGIRSVDDALAAGVMTAQQQIGAKYWRDLDERIPRAEVEEIAAAVHSALRAVLEREGVPPAAVHAAAEATACGSYRGSRARATSTR